MIILCIIIPVHNVELYIRRCLDSLFSQDIPFNSYEVIIINDETPDNSMMIVDEYARKYHNIKIINQKNQGLSGARNAGLKVATGNYVWFVDSDDNVEPNCFSQVISYLMNYPCDIMAFDFLFQYSDGKYKRGVQKFNPNSKYMNGSDFMFLNGASQVWRNIYSREFLNDKNIFFTPGKLHEDIDFNARAKILANKITYLPKVFYYYYVSREGSITNVVGINNLKDQVDTTKLIVEFRKTHNFSNYEIHNLYTPAAYALFTAIYEYRLVGRKNKSLFINHLMVTKKYWFECVYNSFVPTRKKIIGIFLYVMPKITIELLSFYFNIQKYINELNNKGR